MINYIYIVIHIQWHHDNQKQTTLPRILRQSVNVWLVQVDLVSVQTLRKILALLLKRRFYERSNANIGKHDNKINKTEWNVCQIYNKFYMKTCSFKNIVVIIIIIIIIIFANSCLRIIKWYFLIYIDFYYIRVKILLHSFIQQKVEQKGLTKVFTSLDLPSTPDLIVIPPRSWREMVLGIMHRQ